MRFEHPDHPGRAVRLGYGLNLWPSEDAAGVRAGLREIALPLAARLRADVPGAAGVGAWLPGAAAQRLAEDEHERAELLDVLQEGDLDAFTFNAFPYAGFHGAGLKEKVFLPTWKDEERLRFTLAVARVAALARAARGGSRAGEHLSISTHAGLYGADLCAGDREHVARNLARAALGLARIEEETGERIVLALEPEPRSSANDTRELAALHALVRARAGADLAPELAGERAEETVRRHLGTCLDACHAAVEFEDPAEAFARATSDGTALGKLQFSNALALRAPDASHAGRARLFALHEPIYLHQVTGRRADEAVRVRDLDELAARWNAADPRWRGCEEWRCHFHVPVDLAGLGADGLETTRAAAEQALAAALADVERWGSQELHVEVETYTWNVLGHEARGAGLLLDGLERELRHVVGRLAAAGWRPAPRAR